MIQAMGKNWKIDLLESNLRLQLKARGLSYELWDLAWELKHAGPTIKMGTCDGGEIYQLTFENQCGKLLVSTPG